MGVGVNEEKVSSGGMLKPIYPLLGVALGIIVILVLSGLTIADAVSGELSTAATVIAGFLSLVALIAVIKIVES
jgi:hypothetical protein